MQPKVSVIIPIFNVERYLSQCLDSVVNQTLKEIEIICVNDGSTDKSLDIIKEYASKDSRIVIIDKKNSGYGHSMNCGMDIAKGEYIGIIESDDYAELQMFEKLYNLANKKNLDVVKSGFFYYWTKPEIKNEAAIIASKSMSNRIFCPLTDFKSSMEQVEFFNIKPTIWSAIYKKNFITANNIRFNETPGASYQDESFNFKVWASAKRVQLLQDCFVHYRQDNEASSINSPGKVFCICDEYEEMERFLEERPILKGKLEGIRTRLKYDSYIWNYERLSESLQKEFLPKMSQEFADDLAEGYCERKYYPTYKWNTMLLIIRYFEEYHKWRTAEREGRVYNVKIIPNETFAQKFKRKLIGGYYCWKEHGFIYTFNNLIGKIKRRLFKQ